MVRNNIEVDIKVKCIESEIAQAQMVEDIGTTSSYINRIVKKKESVVNKTFVQMMEALSYDIELIIQKETEKAVSIMGMSFRHSAGFGKRILSSEEFLKECVTNKTGKNAGKRSIWFNGNKTERNGTKKEYCKPQFEKYICNDFSRFY